MKTNLSISEKNTCEIKGISNKKFKKINPTNNTWRFVKKGLAVFAVFIMVAVGFSGWVMKNASSSITGNLPPASGDWIITEETVVKSESIAMNGDIIVENGGCLTLEYSKLRMNSGSSNTYKIEVLRGGKLTAKSTTISSGDSNYNYDLFFLPGSSGDLIKCTITDCGTTSPGSEGIKIETNDVRIINCTITNCYHGINIVDGSPSMRSWRLSVGFVPLRFRTEKAFPECHCTAGRVGQAGQGPLPERGANQSAPAGPGKPVQVHACNGPGPPR